MVYKSKKPKKESPQLAFLRKQREEEFNRAMIKSANFFRTMKELEKKNTRRGNR